MMSPTACQGNGQMDSAYAQDLTLRRATARVVARVLRACICAFFGVNVTREEVSMVVIQGATSNEHRSRVVKSSARRLG